MKPQTIRANGIDICYRLEGPANAPVVMFSKSLLTDLGMWDMQVEALAAGLRMLRYDTRGHGGSGASDGAYTIDLLADDALALLDALRIERAHFVGLSLGGMIAQRVAARRHERIAKLVLCDTACHMPPESAWNDRIALARSKGTAAFIGPMTERWLTAPFRAANPAVLDRLGAMIARTSVAGLVGCASAIRDMNQHDILARIAAPTLVVVGEHDVGTPVAAARVLRDAIAGARMTIVADAGHLPNIEHPVAFNRVLVDFLASR